MEESKLIELKSYKRGSKVCVDLGDHGFTGVIDANDTIYRYIALHSYNDSGCSHMRVNYDDIVSIKYATDPPIEEPLPWDDMTKMSPVTFQALLDELDGNSLQTLKEKNARYAQNGDCLHNFRSGAEIAGGTPAQACWGYMTKHLVALRDMVERNDFSNREDFLEKCQDTINYIRFLWCIGNDEK